ncbi:MAG: DUF1217 domain-containing protein [Parvibaculaceae bacterium]
MLTTAVSYRMIASNLDRSLEIEANKPTTAREAAYYLDHIEDIKSIDDFMKDDRIFKFAMKAFGLADMDYAKAFMRKMLTEGIDSDDSFANQFADKRYRDFVKTFNFKQDGETTTVFTDARQGVVDRYIRQSLEESAGSSNEGVRLALYFERKASTITDAYSILADKALLQVFQTAFGISPTTSMADIDYQAKMIEAKLDIEDLQDPEKLSKFLNRFTTMWEASNPSSGSAATSTATLIGQPVEMGISTNLLMSIQNLKLGGV